MQTNCSVCGAPIRDDAKFCSHCGAKLPDSTQKLEIKSEIKIEDSARLEEVRLKYELEERERQEKKEAGRSSSRIRKIKLWTSWLLCIAFLCIGMALFYSGSRDQNKAISTIFMILFMASGIYALIVTFSSIINRFRRK